MSVQWKPQSGKPKVADHRDLNEWRESNRYREIIAEQNRRNKACGGSVYSQPTGQS